MLTYIHPMIDITIIPRSVDWTNYITLTNNVDLEFRANPELLCNTQLMSYLLSISSIEAVEEIIECFEEEYGYYLIEPYAIGALTSSQIITDDYNLWWFPQYEAICPIKNLLEFGKFIFTYAGKLEYDGDNDD